MIESLCEMACEEEKVRQSVEYEHGNEPPIESQNKVSSVSSACRTVSTSFIIKPLCTIDRSDVPRTGCSCGRPCISPPLCPSLVATEPHCFAHLPSLPPPPSSKPLPLPPDCCTCITRSRSGGTERNEYFWLKHMPMFFQIVMLLWGKY